MTMTKVTMAVILAAVLLAATVTAAPTEFLDRTTAAAGSVGEILAGDQSDPADEQARGCWFGRC